MLMPGSGRQLQKKSIYVADLNGLNGTPILEGTSRPTTDIGFLRRDVPSPATTQDMRSDHNHESDTFAWTTEKAAL